MQDFDWFPSPSRQRDIELEELVVNLYNRGFIQVDIANKLGVSKERVSYIVNIRKEMANVSTEVKSRRRGKPGYTPEERESLITDILELYNSGMAVGDVAEQLNRSVSSTETWIRTARKEGYDVRETSRRTSKPKEEECEEPAELAVVDEKQNGAGEIEEIEVLTDKDKMIDDVIDTVKIFANSHLMLGQHIEKMFEMINKSDGE